jgi:hypothetical protein
VNGTGSKRLSAPPTTRLADPKAELAHRELVAKIVELQGLPSSVMRVLADVELKQGVETTVVHNLGRAPAWVKESCVRYATATGRVEEVRGGKFDRTKYVVLKATGFGATIVVDLVVL